MFDAMVINPFRDNVVQNAWQSPSDVSEIHLDVFQACLAGLDSAARGVPDSLLIYGPAGSGKTHLLTRLQRHLAETAAAAPDRVLRCVFVFVRLQTSPSLLWQHVRKRFAADLMRRDQGVTQLQRLVAHQMSLADGASPRARVMGLRVLSEADQGTLIGYLARVADSLGLARDLHLVLEHLVCGRYVRDAFAWLAGESLPENVLSQLGVGPDVIEDRESAARDVVTALCRLAGETLPIVFCFDQIEALQRGIEDRDAFFRFGRVAAELCDADPNVFLITCLQSSYLHVIDACVRGADLDRMARRKAVLQDLSSTQVEKLLLSRLEQLGDQRDCGHSRFAPFDDAVVKVLAQDVPCVARRVLANAAQEFDKWLYGRTATPVDDEGFLRNEFDARRSSAIHDSTPADTERLILQGLEAISVMRAVRGTVPEPKTADFVLDGVMGDARQIAVEICNEADGRSLGPRLKRILANTPRKDGARTVILRDPRLPVAKNATRTREHLKALQARGVGIVEPTVEALAALAALGELLADAKSGDLANQGHGISENRVVDWLRKLATDLAMEPIAEFVDALIGQPADPIDSVAEDLAELLARKRIMELETASAHLDVPAARVAEVARKLTARFLLLEGPPEIVVDVAGVVAESTPDDTAVESEVAQ